MRQLFCLVLCLSAHTLQAEIERNSIFGQNHLDIFPKRMLVAQVVQSEEKVYITHGKRTPEPSRVYVLSDKLDK